jgi:hypothetical protein
MGTYADNKENTCKEVLGLIYRFKHYEIEYVSKIGHLELIPWWYYDPFFTVAILFLASLVPEVIFLFKLFVISKENSREFQPIEPSINRSMVPR